MTRPMTPNTRGFELFKARLIDHIDRKAKWEKNNAQLVEQEVSRGPVCAAMPVRFDTSGMPIPY